MRGRKSKHESRSAELRQKLMIWKQTPESSRPSLRELARKLNTSHQLLKHYLDHLEQWQLKDDYKWSKSRIKAIRDRAEAEKRAVTALEKQHIYDHDRAAMDNLLDSVVLGALTKWERDLEQDVKAGRPPAPQARKLLRIFATQGNRQAQAILAKYFPSDVKNQKTNLPQMPRRTAKSFRSVPDYLAIPLK